MAGFSNVLQREPALTWITLLSAIAAVVTRLAHLTPDQAASVSVATVAAGSLITAAVARPVNVAVISGASGSILAALAGFGLHLSADDIALVTAAIGLIVGLVVRSHLTPVATLREGKTVTPLPQGRHVRPSAPAGGSGQT